MLQFMSTSVKLCQASVRAGILTSHMCMPQLAACALASRSYSITSLRDWTAQSACVQARALSRPCIQPSSFAMQALQLRGVSKLTPRFKGSKLKPYSSYKERFKTTATGLIMYKRPGHRHKRFNKGPHRNRQLRRTQLVTNAYTATMQRLGFVSRRF